MYDKKFNTSITYFVVCALLLQTILPTSKESQKNKGCFQEYSHSTRTINIKVTSICREEHSHHQPAKQTGRVTAREIVHSTVIIKLAYILTKYAAYLKRIYIHRNQVDG